MTPERAQDLLQEASEAGEFDLSPLEQAYVRGICVRLPGCPSLVQTLEHIAAGRAVRMKPMIGTAVFSNRHTGDIVVQTPVYEGETLDGPAVQVRARRSIELLGVPASDPVHGYMAALSAFGSAVARFYPLGS